MDQHLVRFKWHDNTIEYEGQPHPESPGRRWFWRDLVGSNGEALTEPGLWHPVADDPHGEIVFDHWLDQIATLHDDIRQCRTDRDTALKMGDELCRVAGLDHRRCTHAAAVRHIERLREENERLGLREAALEGACERAERAIWALTEGAQTPLLTYLQEALRRHKK